MSNRAYLTCTGIEHVYPSLDPSYRPDRHTVLACDGCVPLVWLAGLSATDLRSELLRFEGPVQEIRAVAPLFRRDVVAKRLEERRRFLNGLFAANGGLDLAIDAFVEHVARFEEPFLSVEYEEIAALGDPASFETAVADTLEKLDASNPSCKDGLVGLSTVLEDRKFLPFEQAAQSEDGEDRWNVFRLLGGEWIAEAPWSFIDPQRALHAKLNQRRPRGTFELYREDGSEPTSGKFVGWARS